jgi:hypothetical protein
LSCQIAAKSDFCHVHKHLDTNSVGIEKLIEKEEQSTSEDDITISFREELRGKCYELVPRSYNGPKLNHEKMDTINDIYLSELKRKLNIYGRIINNIVNEPNVKLSISDINSIKGEIEESLVILHNKTDESIKSVKKLKSSGERLKHSKNYGKSQSPYYDITSLANELEDEKSKVQLRSYNGPELDPYILRKINRVYASEKKSKDDTYDGNIKMLSFYTSFEELGGSASYIKDEIARSLSKIAEDTDATVEALIPPKESTPLSKYY